METDLKEHIAQIANFVQTQAFQPSLIDALKEALVYPGNDRPALVARIPVICNDLRWIKRALYGLYALIGTGIIGIILSNLGASIKL